jgi:hypothetical protein
MSALEPAFGASPSGICEIGQPIQGAANNDVHLTLLAPQKAHETAGTIERMVRHGRRPDSGAGAPMH